MAIKELTKDKYNYIKRGIHIMAITDTITLSRFRDYFFQSDQYKDCFSYEGLEYLYEDFKHLQEDYKDIGNMEDLEQQTTVIKFNNNRSFIIQQF